MFGEFFERRRYRGAARHYALRLGPQMLKDYGSSALYSPRQIEKSADRAGLPARYIAFGYALYLEESAFREMGDGKVSGSYEELRSLLKRCTLRTPSSGFEPAGENSMAMSGGGEAHHAGQ